VLQHGGDIQAGERPGGGASFAIALPLAAPEAGSDRAEGDAAGEAHA